MLPPSTLGRNTVPPVANPETGPVLSLPTAAPRAMEDLELKFDIGAMSLIVEVVVTGAVAEIGKVGGDEDSDVVRVDGKVLLLVEGGIGVAIWLRNNDSDGVKPGGEEVEEERVGMVDVNVVEIVKTGDGELDKGTSREPEDEDEI